MRLDEERIRRGQRIYTPRPMLSQIESGTLDWATGVTHSVTRRLPDWGGLPPMSATSPSA